MSINDFLQKIKPFYTLILILVIATILFTLNRLFELENDHTPIRIRYANTAETGNTISSVASNIANPGSGQTSVSGEVVGSKSGKKYYFPWCGTLKRVKLENRVPFPSIEAARAAGYTPAKNCKGLR